ncbi:hypothetical protein CISG_05356 [Coccidioides immitis RMSCC 3703]|uniref:Uncharacterized protein n=1 Tax=Coccidioides immitis RMSCC 3703 TaxID=454286 RepID=A0A0J8QTB7_COCIT|nr:hypothetical protein CISG_05356 [Coccidioides immitis RMSCC 3703]
MSKGQWDATHVIYCPTTVSLDLRRYDRVTQIGYDQSLGLWDVWCPCIYPAQRTGQILPFRGITGRGWSYGREGTFSDLGCKQSMLAHYREWRVGVLDVRRTRGFQQMFYRKGASPRAAKATPASHHLPDLIYLSRIFRLHRRFQAKVEKIAFIPRANIYRTGNTMMDYDIPTIQKYVSFRGVSRAFCGVCGATLFWYCDARPGVVGVSVGQLDNSSGVRPEGWLDSAPARTSRGEWYGKVSPAIGHSIVVMQQHYSVHRFETTIFGPDYEITAYPKSMIETLPERPLEYLVMLFIGGTAFQCAFLA